MKIEFDCQRCQSTLRVDPENGGKPVRCPVCGSVAVAPLGAAAESAPPPSVVSLKPEPFIIRDDSPPPDSSSWRSLSPAGEPGRPPIVDPWQSPAQPPRPSPIRQPRPGGPNDGYWTFAMVVGIMALVLHVTVCGCGTMLSGPLAIAGLVAAYNSSSANRRTPLMINGIALTISLVLGALFALGTMLAGVMD